MNFHVRLLTITITTLLLLAVVFVWMTVLDKGTVEVSVQAGMEDGAAPYTLSFQGAAVKGGRKIECPQNPCSTKLPSGSYGLTVTRGGYFEEVTSVTVARGKTSTVEMALRFIPTVAAISENYETLKAVFEPDRGLGRFRFGMDTKYKKQRLTYREPGGGEDVIWAYFDRSLKSPAVFPNASFSQGLVVDGADGSTYWIRLITGGDSERSWVGSFEGVEDVLWVGQWVLMKTENGLQWGGVEDRSQKTEDRSGEGNSIQNQFFEWPFTLTFDQIVAEPGEGGRVLFLTTADLLSLENSGGVPSTLDVVKNLINGKVGGEIGLSLVEYTPAENRYRVVHAFTADLGLTQDNAKLAYDVAGERWLVTAGGDVWEVQW